MGSLQVGKLLFGRECRLVGEGWKDQWKKCFHSLFSPDSGWRRWHGEPFGCGHKGFLVVGLEWAHEGQLEELLGMIDHGAHLCGG